MAASNGNTEVSNPLSITKDGIGNVYVGDFFSCVIRKVDVTGIISTYAGTGVCGNTGNRGPATSAEFGYSTGLAADAEGNLYVSDNLFSGLREVSAGTMTVTEIVGGAALGAGFTGDGGPASLAKLHYPGGISLDGTGNIYIADTANNRIRKIDAGTRIIHTVAGNGMGAYTGDGSATGNALNQPNSVFADVNGNLFVADQDSHLLRWVTPSGTMITYAGTVPTTNGKSSAGFSGDGGPALQAQLYYPAGISRDSSGNTYVADNYNDRIRQVTPFAGYGLSTVNLTFGTQAVGSKSIPQSILLSAVGPTMIDSIAVAAPFSETDDCAGVSLTAGQTCRINVYFQPTTTAQVTRSLTIQSNAFFALNPSSITLSGPDKGAASTLSLSGSLAFGTESLKVASPKTVTLTNSGATAATLERIYVTETTDFSIHGGTCPIGVGALAANSSCTILVNFTPQTAGSKIGNLKVESSDPASPLALSHDRYRHGGEDLVIEYRLRNNLLWPSLDDLPDYHECGLGSVYADAVDHQYRILDLELGQHLRQLAGRWSEVPIASHIQSDCGRQQYRFPNPDYQRRIESSHSSLRFSCNGCFRFGDFDRVRNHPSRDHQSGKSHRIELRPN